MSILDQGPDYERGFVDGAQHQMKTSVDKAVNKMAQRDWVETNNQACAILRQVHDMLALASYPPRKTWVGLTDEEIEDAIDDGFAFGLDDGNVSNQTVIRYVRVIEAKLKEKNT